MSLAGLLPWIVWLAEALLIGPAAADPGRVAVSDFARTGTADWEDQVFSGETRYVVTEVGGRRVLRAEAHGTASGLVRRIEVDLTRTPFLTWSWRVEDPLHGLEERTKAGDDYAARVYVVQSGGIFFWRSRAVNYVWSGSQPAGSTWPNAYTERACMIAVSGPADQTAGWRSERRDVRADFRRCFGVEVTKVDAVALMTDTDNSGGRTAALYGEIAFQAE